jgi:hypothetical protein
MTTHQGPPLQPGPEEEIVEYALGFVPATGPIDWDDLLYRIEVAFGIDLPSNMAAPEITRLQKAIRTARREAQE